MARTPDYTRYAVRDQLKAMGCDRFEVGLRDPETGRMQQQERTPDQILDALLYMKWRNRDGGRDIYIRPARSADHDLILVDDLDAGTVAWLPNEGLTPAAVTETSPGNFQAWIRFGSPMPEAERTDISRWLAHRYGGDPSAVGADRYGRLAGFTNRKPKYRQSNGQFPFVRLRSHKGSIIDPDKAPEIRSLAASGKAPTASRRPVRRRALIATGEAYAQAQRDLEGRYGADRSRLDWHVVKLLFRNGHSAPDIAQALRSDPEIDRKRDPDYYVNRTIEKATGTRLEAPQS